MAGGVVLNNSKLKRAGRTARHWVVEFTAEIRCDVDSDGVGIQFSLSSKGGGTLDVRVCIDPRDFANLLGEMGKAERMEAMLAMSQRLAHLVAEQPTQDATVTKCAHDAVVKAAEEKALYAPPETADLEELVAKRVRALINELGQPPNQVAT